MINRLSFKINDLIIILVLKGWKLCIYLFKIVGDLVVCGWVWFFSSIGMEVKRLKFIMIDWL